MDETVVVKTDTDLELPIGHQFGKLVFSSIAGFGASKLADGLYDAVVRARRARKSS